MSNQELQLNNDWSTKRAAIYADAGHMLRHYSSSRTVVLSLTFPVCLGILGWVLSNQVQTIAIYLLSIEALVCAYGISLSLFFSMKYHQIRKILVEIEAGKEVKVYSVIVSLRLRNALHFDPIDKTIILISILFHLIF
jgi:hypothetical protein